MPLNQLLESIVRMVRGLDQMLVSGSVANARNAARASRQRRAAFDALDRSREKAELPRGDAA